MRSSIALPARGACFSGDPRDALLQHFQDNGGCALGGFADEQMNVVGHDHISDQQEFVAFTNFPRASTKTLRARVVLSSGSRR